MAAAEHTSLLAKPSSSALAPASTAARAPAAAAPRALALSATAEALLSLSAVALGAFAGVGVRVGFSYYDGRGLTTGGFTVLFAELAGCFIMGVAVSAINRNFGLSATRLSVHGT
jgi:hypothetical protein